MGSFGTIDGHTDEGNDEAGLTCMISNSRIPDDYKPGRTYLVLECIPSLSQGLLRFSVALEDTAEPHSSLQSREYDGFINPCGLMSRVVTGAGEGSKIETLKKPAPAARV